ncbi:MAG: Lrp/AsnC family transcriptional regulator [archaeon]
MEEIYSLEYGEKVKLDNKDKKILEQLQINAKQSISDLAKKTKLPRDVVKYRIKKLEKNKVIRFYHALLNPSKLGYPLYAYTTFALLNIKPDDEEKFINFLKRHPKIIYIAKFSGRWDFCIGICAKDYKDLDETIREIRKNFIKIIKDFEVAPVIQEYKYDYMVDLI